LTILCNSCGMRGTKCIRYDMTQVLKHLHKDSDIIWSAPKFARHKSNTGQSSLMNATHG
jgi:hypothetical protein